MNDINKKYLDDPHFRRILNSLMNIELVTVAVSGYFDPLHVGHLEMLEKAKSLGDKLIVIVNSDEQAALKKGKSFMDQYDRHRIVRALECVDEAFISIDKDRSVCKSLRLCKPHIFANGGERGDRNTPEMDVCRELDIQMIWGMGGNDKPQSSSWLVEKFREKK